jgi:aminocarboxymuconate-semialdehyde decarboxylase
MKKMLDPSLQIADMDSRGIDRSVLSSATVIQGLSFAEGDRARTLNRRLNDATAKWVSRFPRRFIGSFCLPLGDVDDALAEMERALSIGLRVANLPAEHKGRYLGNRRFEPLWTAIEEKGVVVFIHPDGVKDPWYQSYWMWNSIGQSIEEVRVMTSLIYEGTLERHPGLKIVMAHGGGYMPHYMGRLDRNATNQPSTMANISQKPSAYLRRFYYDSIVYDPKTLSALIASVGIDRVVLGADYPVAHLDPVKFLENIPDLSAADIAAIAGNNAARLLGV